MSITFNHWELPVNNTKKIALAVAILCSAGSVLAQEINPSWYVQPSVIYMKPDRDFGTDHKDWGGGLKFGKAVHPMWDIQFGASYVKSSEGPADYKQGLLGVDALLMFSRQAFRPFVLFGIGAEHDKVENPLRDVSKTSPYYTVGLGFQASLTPQWSLQADVRTVRGHLRDDQDFGFSRSNNKYLTLALNYAFNPPPAPPAPPAPAPEPTPVVEQTAPQPEPVAPPPPPAHFEKVTLSSTELFEFNKATLRMPQPKLDEIAAALQADPSITDIDVDGYTDRLGSKKYNQKLSQRRAEAVRDYLISKGIDGSRLKARGMGEANPIVTDCHQKKRKALIDCLAPNRRVEVEQITIEKKVQ
jgi:OOP family OmpA-OmpF porin